LEVLDFDARRDATFSLGAMGSIPCKGAKMANIQAVIDQMTDAYESKDLQVFANFLTEDFTWFDKDGNVVIAGRDDFLSEVAKYFESNPNAKSTLSSAIILGNLATQTETVTGLADGKTDVYLWVYEFDGDKIAKQWGFLPAA
jgi:hypothetical protein